MGSGWSAVSLGRLRPAAELRRFTSCARELGHFADARLVLSHPFEASSSMIGSSDCQGLGGALGAGPKNERSESLQDSAVTGGEACSHLDFKALAFLTIDKRLSQLVADNPLTLRVPLDFPPKSSRDAGKVTGGQRAVVAEDV